MASVARLLRAGSRQRKAKDGHVPVLRFQGHEVWCDPAHAQPTSGDAWDVARRVRAHVLTWLAAGIANA